MDKQTSSRQRGYLRKFSLGGAASTPEHIQGRSGRRIKLLLAVVLGLVSVILCSPASVAQQEGAETYTNPVAGDEVAVFPDPVSIRGKDGYWYAYATTNPTLQNRGDDSLHYVPIMRSSDMVDWEYVEDLYTKETLPDWIPEDASLWAPDVRYIDGKYYLYYSVAYVPPGAGFGSPEATFTMGVATAPTPTGPWTDSGGPIIPEDDGCETFTDIDPAQFTDTDGTRYMYWGSFRALCVAEMNEDATRVVGEVTKIADVPGEGPYVVKQGGYYYMFYSESACCDGRFSGYHLKVARSENPRGPFVDRQGVPLNAAQGGGTFVVSANGNKWVGTGHNSVQTDLSGQDWLVYHGVPRDDPYLEPSDRFGEPYQYTTRRMLIDRLDWIDGWPVVRAGKGASEDAQPAPVTEWDVGSSFNDRNALRGWNRRGAARGAWRVRRERDALGYVQQRAPAGKESYLVSREKAPAEVRVEGDLRIDRYRRSHRDGSVGLVAAWQNPGNHIVARLDSGRRALVTDVIVNGRSTGRRATSLPGNFDFSEWHNVAAEIRGNRMQIEVSSDRLGDPVAVQRRSLPAAAVKPGSVGVVSSKARSEADNVGGVRLFKPVKREVPPPEVGEATFEDDFDDGVAPGTTEDSPWSWVRDPEGTEAGGTFNWPTNSEEIFLDTNNASLLLLDEGETPSGDYTTETKVTFSPERGNQEAGLVLYVDDDQYLTLTHELFRNRWDLTKFLKEGTSEETGLTAGRTFGGPPATTTWLRLSHRIDPDTGEHEVRSGTSRDGENWVWGSVWTLPPDTQPRVGLVSMGNSGATAQFDYFRTYQP